MITPPVGGAASSIQSSLVFMATAILGAMTTGVMLYATGAVIRQSEVAVNVLRVFTLFATVVVLSLLLFRDGQPVLSHNWGIPRRWAAYGRVRFAAIFGFSLGLGWRTRTGSNVWWLLVLWSLHQQLLVCLLAFIVFASIRAFPVAVITYVRSLVTRRYRGQLTLNDADLLRRAANSTFIRNAAVLATSGLAVVLISAIARPF